MKYLAILLILGPLFLFQPTITIAQSGEDSVQKEKCLSATGYDNVRELKIVLEAEAKRLAAGELFGEFISSYTELNEFALTKDQIQLSSVGYVRIIGSPRFYNHETNLAEVCVLIEAYTTDEDRQKLEPVELSNDLCETDDEVSTQELQQIAKDKAILGALLNYENGLDEFDEAEVIRLLKNINYLESEFDSRTGAYCVSLVGEVLPIEVITMLNKSDVQLDTSASDSSTEQDDDSESDTVLSVNSAPDNDMDKSEPIIYKCLTVLGEELEMIGTFAHDMRRSLGEGQAHDLGFRASANEPVQFAIEPEFLAVLSIWDADECVELISKDEFRADQTNLLNFVPNKDGNFFVRTSAYYGNGNGNYILTFINDSFDVPQSRVPDDYFSYKCTSPLPVDIQPIGTERPKYTLSQYIQQPTDLGFAADVNEPIQFIVEPEFLANVTVFDADSCEALVSREQFRAGEIGLFEFIPNKEGDFFVRVTGYYASSNGNYTLTYSDAPFEVPQAESSEDLFSYTCATNLPVEIQSIGPESPEYLLSHYQSQFTDLGFTAEANEAIQFIIKPNFRAVVSVFDAETCESLNSRNDFVTDEVDVLEFFPNQDGNYFVRVEGYYHTSAGNFRILYNVE